MQEPTTAATGRRRAQRRQATYEQLMTNARTALAEGRQLSLRAIASDMGMTAPALYRYVESLAELQTRLASQIYADVVARVERAGQDCGSTRPGQRLLAGLVEFRAWALERPEEFRLLFDQLQLGWDIDESGDDCAAEAAAGTERAAAEEERRESEDGPEEDSDDESADTAGLPDGGQDAGPGEFPGPTPCEAPLAVQFFAPFMACLAELEKNGDVEAAPETDIPAGASESVKRHVLAAGAGRGLESAPLGLWWTGLREWVLVCGVIRMEVDGLVPATLIEKGSFFREALERWGQTSGADGDAVGRALDNLLPQG